MKTKLKKSLLVSLIASLYLIYFSPLPTLAISESRRKSFGQNNILFYDPCDTTSSAVQAATAIAVNVHGETIFDKFYFGLLSLYSSYPTHAKAFAALLAYYSNQEDVEITGTNYVHTFLDEIIILSKLTEKESDLSIITNVSDENFLTGRGDAKSNELIAHYIMGLKYTIDSNSTASQAIFTKTSPEDIIDYYVRTFQPQNIFNDKDDFLRFYNYITNEYIPKSGATPGYTYIPNLNTDSISACEQQSLIEIVAPTVSTPTETEAPESADPSLPEGYTPTTPVSGNPTTTYNGYTVVNTPISLASYVSSLRSKGIRQSARPWKHTEVRNGLSGWSDQCLQLANAQANGLLHGTYPSTSVSGNPASGSGWTSKENLSLSEFLGVVYDQITSGHPLVVKVTLHRNKVKNNYFPAASEKDTRHFVTIVGFKSSVTSLSQLTSTDQLYILDSWDAQLYDASSSNARVFRPNEHIKWQSGTGYSIRYQTR